MSTQHLKYTLRSLLDRSTDLYGSNLALAYIQKQQITYHELGKLISQMEHWFVTNGVQKGDKIAILSENCPHWAVAFFAITHYGAVAVPILPDFSAAEVNNILSHSESKMLFISHRLQTKLGNDLKFHGVMIQIDHYQIEGTEKRILDFDYHHKQSNLTLPDLSPDDLASIIYTSGTTGRSKGVMLSHENLTYVPEKVLHVQNVTERDVFLSILPLSHVYENVLGLILPIRQGGSIHYMTKPPTPSILLATLQHIKPTMMLSVPLIIEKIYNSKIKPKLGLDKKFSFKRLIYFGPFRKLINRKAGRAMLKVFGNRLRFFGIGGAPLDPVVEKFLHEAHFPFSCGYGLTETASLVAGSRVKHVAYRSVGHLLEGLECKIGDGNSEEGEIIVKGPSVMKGYYKDEEMTRSVLKDGWFHTGDLGSFEHRNLYIRGRSKNMILGPSGENIYPEEIEAVLNNMEGVMESMVYESKGKIIAKVYLNQEELAKKYEFFKQAASEKHSEVHKKVVNYMQQMKHKLNGSLNRFSHVSELRLISQPFEKTPTHKIKRYLYLD